MRIRQFLKNTTFLHLAACPFAPVAGAVASLLWRSEELSGTKHAVASERLRVLSTITQAATTSTSAADQHLQSQQFLHAGGQVKVKKNATTFSYAEEDHNEPRQDYHLNFDYSDLAKSFYHFDFAEEKWVESPFPPQISVAGGLVEDSTTSAKRTSTSSRMNKTTYSQFGQDWLVQTLLNCKQNGFFIELGSHDATLLSNSFLLEKNFHWQGLCLEADPQYLNGYKHRKRCKLVQNVIGSSPTGKEVEFAFHPAGATNGLSGIVGENFDNKKEDGDDFYSTSSQQVQEPHHSAGTKIQKTKSVSLADVWRHFNAPTQIDYFSLDVEGAEGLVLDENFPWDELRFRVLTVERAKPELEQVLEQHGYRKVRLNSVENDATWLDSRSTSSTSRGESFSTNLSKFANGKSLEGSCMAQAGFRRPPGLMTLL
ncbi:unnamed protein product [Amoebophrya sp. A120]|nr:unnamed protein product [Amoebophrya sp. A120]|eukprot:GSA120T00008378001.1